MTSKNRRQRETGQHPAGQRPAGQHPAGLWGIAARAVLPLLMMAGIAGCDGSAPTPAAPAAPATPATPAAPATPGSASANPSSTDQINKGPRVPPASGTRMAVSHVLIAYDGAVASLPNVKRTKEEALKRAEEARTKLLNGDDFGQIARAYSDDTSASQGGSLGAFDPGTYVPAFEAMVKSLQPGQIGTVIETPFGYHIIRRDPVLEVHIAHLMVSWKGAERAPGTVTRSREEASKRAAEALAAIQGGGDWNGISRKYSDGPLAEQGGDLGWMAKGQLFDPLDGAAMDLDIGATTVILESPRGYHILKRLE